MVTTRASHLEDAAAALFHLADWIEDSGLTAGELGMLLCQELDRQASQLCADARRDLSVLRQCKTNSKDFAQGLRRQAELLRDEIATP